MPRSWRVSEALEYGLVGVNEGLISTEVGSISLSILLDVQNKFATLVFCLVRLHHSEDLSSQVLEGKVPSMGLMNTWK